MRNWSLRFDDRKIYLISYSTANRIRWTHKEIVGHFNPKLDRIKEYNFASHWFEYYLWLWFICVCVCVGGQCINDCDRLADWLRDLWHEKSKRLFLIQSKINEDARCVLDFACLSACLEHFKQIVTSHACVFLAASKALNRYKAK